MTRSTNLLRAALVGACFAPLLELTPGASSVSAQDQPAPSVEWQTWDAPSNRPSGVFYTWDALTSTYIDTDVPGTLQAVDGSGADWHFAVVNTYTNGVHDGYVACGYTNFQNFSLGTSGTTGCAVAPVTLPPTPQIGETYEIRRGGHLLGSVARYDLQGNPVWFRSYLEGALHGVIIDGEGNVVVTGDTQSPIIPDNVNAGLALKYNPQPGSIPISSSDCKLERSQLIVMKLNPINGDVLWANIYGVQADIATEEFYRGSGWDLEPTYDANLINNGYRVIGRKASSIAPQREKPYILDIDLDGLVNWQRLYGSFVLGENNFNAFNNDDPFSWGYAIARTPPTLGEKFAVTGFRTRQVAGSITSAWLMLLDDATQPSTPSEPDWIIDLQNDANTFSAHDPTKNQNATDVCFIVDQGQPAIIWPVLSNYSGGIFPGNHEASGFIYRIPLQNPTAYVWRTDIGGRLRAFDLQLSAIPLSTGGIAVASTRWSPPHTINDPWSFDDLTTAAQNCLTTTFSYAGTNWPTSINAMGFWGTDSYCTKLSNSGEQLWEYQWDDGSAPGAGHVSQCFPDNIRQRQCNFKMCEAADGGIVICGNTGHAFDDAYLVKLSPCDVRATYANLPLDLNNEYHITANTTWSTDMNVKGRIIVDPWVTLTVDGATIGFADTRQMGYTTDLVVMPTAYLLLQNGATLTSVEGCDASMWDGVRVLSEFLDPVLDVTHGRVGLESGSTISNALVGIEAGPGTAPLLMGNYGPIDMGGHIVSHNSNFVNNRIDVLANPSYVYHLPGSQNFSPTLHATTFKTTKKLNYSLTTPKAHVQLRGHYEAMLQSCSFRNERTDLSNSLEMGHGIEAFNQRFRVVSCVQPGCTGGTPNTFSNLDHAVHATASAGNAYFTVDGAVFTDNICGVYAANVPGFAVTNNTVELGRWDVDMTLNIDELNWLGTHRAIFSTDCFGFTTQGNTISPSSLADPGVLKEGIVVGYVRDHNDVVFNNTASGMDVGFAGEGISADILGQGNMIGLQFQCNDNTGNATNLLSRKANGADPADQDFHTVRGTQGSTVLAAGNGFDQASNGFDFEMTTTQIPLITYYYAPRKLTGNHSISRAFLA